MNQALIFWPMGGMAALTFVVLVMIPIQRFRAAFPRRSHNKRFQAWASRSSVPNWVALANRNYMNLLEAPTLFYPACLMFFVTHRVGVVALAVAWTFVGLRAAHSLIHLAYNNVFHRLVAFGLSNAALGTLWALFFIGLR